MGVRLPVSCGRLFPRRVPIHGRWDMAEHAPSASTSSALRDEIGHIASEYSLAPATATAGTEDPCRVRLPRSAWPAHGGRATWGRPQTRLEYPVEEEAMSPPSGSPEVASVSGFGCAQESVEEPPGEPRVLESPWRSRGQASGRRSSSQDSLL